MFHVRYELCFYIPEDGILHSHRRENLKFYTVAIRIALTLYLYRHPYSTTAHS
jgi:hypothetical protein